MNTNFWKLKTKRGCACVWCFAYVMPSPPAGPKSPWRNRVYLRRSIFFLCPTLSMIVLRSSHTCLLMRCAHDFAAHLLHQLRTFLERARGPRGTASHTMSWRHAGDWSRSWRDDGGRWGGGAERRGEYGREADGWTKGGGKGAGKGTYGAGAAPDFLQPGPGRARRDLGAAMAQVRDAAREYRDLQALAALLPSEFGYSEPIPPPGAHPWQPPPWQPAAQTGAWPHAEAPSVVPGLAAAASTVATAVTSTVGAAASVLRVAHTVLGAVRSVVGDSAPAGKRTREEPAAEPSTMDLVADAVAPKRRRAPEAEAHEMADDPVVRALSEQLAASRAEARRLRMELDRPEPSPRTSLRSPAAPQAPPAHVTVEQISDLVERRLADLLGEDGYRARRAAMAAPAQAANMETDAEELEGAGPAARLPAGPPTPMPKRQSAAPPAPAPRAAAPLELAPLPERVTPALHKQFHSWMGIRSSIPKTVEFDEWVGIAGKRFSAKDWAEKASALGLRKVPSTKGPILAKLMRLHLAMASGDAAAPTGLDHDEDSG